jgi:hypothetical protein
MQIVIYCPDRHFVYDGTTPDQAGVGGGLTARVRIAAALAKRGNRVSVICNCSRETIHRGVLYRPLESIKSIETDALVMHSSGGACDLSELLSIPVQAKTRITVLSGLGLATGTEQLDPDAFYACSNFLRHEVKRLCPFVKMERFFVSHYGVNRWNWGGWFTPSREFGRLIYTSHPSKGFDAAREIARRLHRHDPRFRLHYFGGTQLWGAGEKEEVPPQEPCLQYGGLINQRELASQYKRSSFLLQLQTRTEPFGIVIVEAMAAGCIVVASPVGAFTELIRSGENGFLVEGDPSSPETFDRAAELIRGVSQNSALLHKIRRRALATPYDWDTLAEVWESHLNWLMDRKGSHKLEADWARCMECGSTCLVLVDGYHCTACGYFSQEIRA